jgi:hypothetical protein
MCHAQSILRSMTGHVRASEKAKGAKESEELWKSKMRDKTVQVKLTNNLSSTAIKSSCIDIVRKAYKLIDLGYMQ